MPALQYPPCSPSTWHGRALVRHLRHRFAAGIGYLVQGQNDRFAWLPRHKVLDEVAYRAVIIGFPIFATLIILGSYWASIAWCATGAGTPRKPRRS